MNDNQDFCQITNRGLKKIIKNCKCGPNIAKCGFGKMRCCMLWDPIHLGKEWLNPLLTIPFFLFWLDCRWYWKGARRFLLFVRTQFHQKNVLELVQTIALVYTRKTTVFMSFNGLRFFVDIRDPWAYKPNRSNPLTASFRKSWTEPIRGSVRFGSTPTALIQRHQNMFYF